MKTSSCFRGKTVLITGASSGIGEALALEANRLGANVALGARRTDRLQNLLQQIPSSRCFVDYLDVRDSQQIQSFVKKANEKFGSIDAVIANAGFAVVGPFEKLSLDDYKRQFETNVWGVIETIRHSLEEIKKSRGRIVIIGSVNSYVSFAGSSPYSMSKYSVRALAESLYHELKPSGVSVTLVCPGLVKSEIRQVDNQGVFHADQPGRVPDWVVMDAHVAAAKILAASAKRKREIVITFHGKLGVWLKRFFPSLFHFFIEKLGVKAGPHRSSKAQV